MTWLVLTVVAALTITALYVAIQLGKPHGPGDAPRDEADWQVLWSNVDSIRRELRRSIEAKAEDVAGRLRETLEDYRDALERDGMQQAEEATKVLRRRAKKYFEDTWFFQRVKFDVKAYVEEQMLPPIIERYDEFRAEAAKALRDRIEGVLGTSLESVFGPPNTNVASRDNDTSSVGVIVGAGAGGAIAAAGYAGGAVVAAPVAALGAAVAAGWAWKNYKSKEELAEAAVNQAERLARRLFHGEGYRDPSDGTLIPSATAWLQKAANELEGRLTRRLERARDEQLRRVDERYHSLELSWRQRQIPPEHLRDPSFIAASLHPARKEATGG